jgi:hypothetical protein
MGISNQRIAQVQREIVGLHDKVAAESKKLADNSGRLNRVQDELTRARTPGMVRLKTGEVQRLQKDIAATHKRRADLEKRLSQKEAEFSRLDRQSREEQDRRQRRLQQDLARQESDRRRQQLGRVGTAFRSASSPLSPFASGPSATDPEPQYDAFICHASEDKPGLVTALAEALTAAGLRIWYDDLELKVGDSLRRSIDRGLARSRFGIVILSPDFFAKEWPQRELDGLIAKESGGEKVVLPIWHKVSKAEVMGHSPTLADKVALSTTDYTPEELAGKLKQTIEAT